MINVAPPYFAVIFSAQLSKDTKGYDQAAVELEALAKTMPGYLGFESSRSENGFGISVSYWDSEINIKNWKLQIDHLEAQKKGRDRWYENYKVEIAKVERSYHINR